MDRKIAGFVFGAAVVCSIIWLVFRHGQLNSSSSVLRPTIKKAETSPERSPKAGLGSLASKPVPTLAQRKLMSNRERLRLLEELGSVPDDADSSDWQLAQKTSWWGTPMDPKRFWSNRVVWLDISAEVAARRHGRGYPPMPYDDPTLARYENSRVMDTARLRDFEGPNILYNGTERESVFWDKFYRNHPKPPEKLEREQSEVAQRFLNERHSFESRGNPARVTEKSLAESQENRKRRLIDSLGLPPEAFSKDALFWSYALKMRRQYQTLMADGQTQDDVSVKNFFHRLAVNRNYITDPLTPEQLQAANAWKVAYLQRLRREKVDESYINSYLNAWNLSADAIVPPSAGR